MQIQDPSCSPLAEYLGRGRGEFSALRLALNAERESDSRICEYSGGVKVQPTQTPSCSMWGTVDNFRSVPRGFSGRLRILAFMHPIVVPT